MRRVLWTVVAVVTSLVGVEAARASCNCEDPIERQCETSELCDFKTSEGKWYFESAPPDCRQRCCEFCNGADSPTCAVCDPDPIDAGAIDAAAIDAAPGPPPPGDDDEGCSLAGDAAPGGGLLLLAALAFVRRQRRSSRA